MAYLFYKVLEFLSNANQCAPTKKVVDLIISPTAMIKPHQKFVFPVGRQGVIFPKLEIFWVYNTLCCVACMHCDPSKNRHSSADMTMFECRSNLNSFLH